MRIIALTVSLVVLSFAAASAQDESPSPQPEASAMPASSTPAPEPASHKYQTYITPYIWVPSFNGQLQISTPASLHPAVPIPPGSIVNIDTHVGPNSYLQHLNFVTMLSAYSSNGDFSIGLDFLYLNLSSSVASVTSVSGPGGIVEVPINVGTGAHMRGSITTLTGGVPLTQSRVSPAEFIFGGRYLGAKASVDWSFSGPLGILDRSGSATRSYNVLDPVFGFRGRIGLSDHWSLPYYVDYGFASTNTTNQEYVGFAYSSRCCDWFLINRWLRYDIQQNATQSIQLVGPTIGVRLKI